MVRTSDMRAPRGTRPRLVSLPVQERILLPAAPSRPSFGRDPSDRGGAARVRESDAAADCRTRARPTMGDHATADWPKTCWTHAMLPRQVLPGQFYLITRRCTQRQFLLRPDPVTNTVFDGLGSAARDLRAPPRCARRGGVPGRSQLRMRTDGSGHRLRMACRIGLVILPHGCVPLASGASRRFLPRAHRRVYDAGMDFVAWGASRLNVSARHIPRDERGRQAARPRISRGLRDPERRGTPVRVLALAGGSRSPSCRRAKASPHAGA